MARDLYAGCDTTCIRVLSGAPGDSTANDARDIGYTSVGLSINGARVACDFTNTAGASDSVASGETLWSHFGYSQNSNFSTIANMWELIDGSDFPWLAIRFISSTTFGLYHNTGTGASPVWTRIGTTDLTQASGNTRYIWDVRLTLGSPHSIDIYRDTGAGSALVLTETFTNANLLANGGHAVVFSKNNGPGYVGSVICSEGKNTIGAKLYQIFPTGAGTVNDFSGSYADVDEITPSDTDFVTSTVAGNKASYTYGDLPSLPAGAVLGDTFVFTRAKNDGSSPTNLKPLRVDGSSVETIGSNMSGIGLTFSSLLARYSLSFAEINASRFGFQSAA